MNENLPFYLTKNIVTKNMFVIVRPTQVGRNENGPKAGSWSNLTTNGDGCLYGWYRSPGSCHKTVTRGRRRE